MEIGIEFGIARKDDAIYNFGYLVLSFLVKDRNVLRDNKITRNETTKKQHAAIFVKRCIVTNNECRPIYLCL